LNGCFDKILAASVSMFGSNGDGSPKAKPRGAPCAAEGVAPFAGKVTLARAAIPPAIPPRMNFKTSRRSTMNLLGRRLIAPHLIENALVLSL
jgi:hypothetical protein